jgi:hypothetical protein
MFTHDITGFNRETLIALGAEVGHHNIFSHKKAAADCCCWNSSLRLERFERRGLVYVSKHYSGEDRQPLNMILMMVEI